LESQFLGKEDYEYHAARAWYKIQKEITPPLFHSSNNEYVFSLLALFRQYGLTLSKLRGIFGSKLSEYDTISKEEWESKRRQILGVINWSKL
jgi:hypothetical protein